jgi:MerR family mercuric resistance operon transcriptional regulator
MNGLKIGQVAEQANVNIETVRYYEKQGLILQVPRTESGYRQFTVETVERIKFIKRAQELGFTLSEVKKILSVSDGNDYDCRDIRQFAIRKIEEIEQKILDLGKIKFVLNELSALCPAHGPVDKCPILQKFKDGGNEMAKRLIEVFTAGCYVCEKAVNEIKALACPNCEVKVYDLNKKCETGECEVKAKQYGVNSLPAVAIDGKLVSCCTNRGIDIEALKKAGLGQQ